MKQMVLVGGVAALMVCVCALARAQTGLQKGQLQAQAVPWASNLQNQPLVLASRGSAPRTLVSPATGLPVWGIQGLLATNGWPKTLVWNGPGAYATGQTNGSVLPAPKCAPAPGVYKTAPYGCLVVVPGPMMDDRCIVGLGGGRCPMATIRPELQFLPWEPSH